MVAGTRVGREDADDSGDDPDHRNSQREDQALGAEGLLAEDQRGHQGDGVGLEEVGGHTGTVTDVVTDVVGDGRGITGVVLGDAGLDLADQVGADVSGLGEDAAADPHEHGQQGRAEAEAFEDLRSVLLEDQDDERGAEQAETDGEHSDSAAGAERDAHGPRLAFVLRRRGHADVAADGKPHAREADREGREGPHDEEERASDP